MWIKICGITTVEDALRVADAGADAIGLNFFPKSKRCVSAQTAIDIADRVRGSVDIVGVFVNSDLRHIAQITQDAGLTAVQFHGDETPSDLQSFQQLRPGIPMIRAFRVGDATPSLQTQFAPYKDESVSLAATLVDAWSATDYGGTGQQVAANLTQDHQQLGTRLILAGGLTPENVAQAASTVKPWGVDTASGVESSPGIKSPELVGEFVSHCRQAFPDDPTDTISAL